MFVSRKTFISRASIEAGHRQCPQPFPFGAWPILSAGGFWGSPPPWVWGTPAPTNLQYNASGIPLAGPPPWTGRQKRSVLYLSVFCAVPLPFPYIYFLQRYIYFTVFPNLGRRRLHYWRFLLAQEDILSQVTAITVAGSRPKSDLRR